jgi:hypothetical protein
MATHDGLIASGFDDAGIIDDRIDDRIGVTASAGVTAPTAP